MEGLLSDEVGIDGTTDPLSGVPTWLHRAKQLLLESTPAQGERLTLDCTAKIKLQVHACMLDGLEGYALGRVVPRRGEKVEKNKRGNTWEPLLKVVKLLEASSQNELARLVWLSAMRAAGWSCPPPTSTPPKQPGVTKATTPPEPEMPPQVLSLSEPPSAIAEATARTSNRFGPNGGPRQCKNGQLLLYTDELIEVPPRCEYEVWFRLPPDLASKAGPFLVTPLPERGDIHRLALIGSSLSSPVEGQVKVRILNPSAKVVVIPSLHPVATVDTQYLIEQTLEPDVALVTYAELTPEQKAKVDQVTIDESNVLTEEQRGQVRDVLARFHDVFADNTKKPKTTHLVELSLELVDGPKTKPVRQPPARVGPAAAEIIREQINTMERDGIIRKSRSPWASRVVLAQKSDGTKRFCVDYRQVNAKCVNKQIPLPHTSSACEIAVGSLYYCGFDLASAFWSVPIREQDKQITAFCTPDGLWEWNNMPFGLTVSPAVMQQLMNTVTDGIGDIVLPYLDDLLLMDTAHVCRYFS